MLSLQHVSWTISQRFNNLSLKLSAGQAALILFFVLASLLSSPFLYDQKNSGRYLLEVLKAADPELFPDDPVAESLQRFSSAFYDALAFTFRVTRAPPEALESLLQKLYPVSKVSLFILLFGLARVFSRDKWLFVLLAVWAAHQKGAPVGGESLFFPALRHSEVALIVGLAAVYFLLQGRQFLFWALLSLAALLHFLMGSHLFLVAVPPFYLAYRRFSRGAFLGLVLFAAACLVYVVIMSPPPMSAAEAQLFLQAKGSINHISPFDQSWLRWLEMIGVASLALLSTRLLTERSAAVNHLIGFVISGFCAGLLLGLLAETTASARLAQFQPMRIFLWVWLFTNFLFVVTLHSALRQRRPVSVLLLAAFTLAVLESLWALVFIYACIACLLATFYLQARKSKLLPALSVSGRAAVLGFIPLLPGTRLVSEVLGLQSEFLQDLTPLPLFFLLALLAFRKDAWERGRMALVAIILLYTLGAASLYWHDYHYSRLDADWYTIQLWSRQHTEKSDTFITTPDTGGNFRTGSFRTTLSEPMSALAWVDPLANLNNAQTVALVERAHNGQFWDLDYLFHLAADWDAQYVIVSGPFSPALEPAYQSGRLSVLQVP